MYSTRCVSIQVESAISIKDNASIFGFYVYFGESEFMKSLKQLAV